MMPSPEDFHRDIRAAKRFGLVQGLLLLPSMFSLILAIAFAVGGDRRYLRGFHRCAGLS